MSTHEILVVPVELEPHNNADTLSVVRIDDCQVVVRTSDWLNRDRGVYIPPDYMVPSEYVPFLDNKGKEKVRIKPVRLRGEISWGLLLPTDTEGFPIFDPVFQDPIEYYVGQNVISCLNIERYNPPIRGTSGENIFGPDAIIAPKYNIENYHKLASRLFDVDEPVFVTEKIHGANSRFVFHDGEMYCGSHNTWKKEGNNHWWNVLKTCDLERVCRENPETVFYGEIYGTTQKLQYGSPNEAKFALFDVRDSGRFLDYNDLYRFELPMVPQIGCGPIPFNIKELQNLSSGDSLIDNANHLREGIVVRTGNERRHPKHGRAVIKFVSPEYLMGNY